MKDHPYFPNVDCTLYWHTHFRIGCKRRLTKSLGRIQRTWRLEHTWWWGVFESSNFRDGYYVAYHGTYYRVVLVDGRRLQAHGTAQVGRGRMLQASLAHLPSHHCVRPHLGLWHAPRAQQFSRWNVDRKLGNHPPLTDRRSTDRWNRTLNAVR